MFVVPVPPLLLIDAPSSFLQGHGHPSTICCARLLPAARLASCWWRRVRRVCMCSALLHLCGLSPSFVVIASRPVVRVLRDAVSATGVHPFIGPPWFRTACLAGRLPKASPRMRPVPRRLCTWHRLPSMRLATSQCPRSHVTGNARCASFAIRHHALYRLSQLAVTIVTQPPIVQQCTHDQQHHHRRALCSPCFSSFASSRPLHPARSDTHTHKPSAVPRHPSPALG